jgi:hypothetical protein
VLKKCYGIFLLFTGCVDVRKKKRDVMSADKGHKPCVIELIPFFFVLAAIRCFVRILTFIDGFVGNLSLIRLRLGVPRLF